MLRLLLLRHAKSDWSDPGLGDHDRPLSNRGFKAAPRVAAVMARKGYIPALCLTSTALRARHTLNLVLAGLPGGGEVPVRPLTALYDFGSGREVRQAIAANGEGASPLLVVGHNPAFHALALNLVSSGKKSAKVELRRKFPTAALAVIDFPITTWAELPGAAGQLVDFIRPKAINNGN